jgi:N,N-dimethylformamidase
MTAELPRKRIIGYADKLSLAPGETIAFKASCEDIPQYRADIVRLICADLHPQGRGWIEEEIESPVSGTWPGREQAIPAGSWGRVPSAPGLCRDSLTVALHLWPTTPMKGEQALLARMDPAGTRGWMLMIDKAGALALRIATAKGTATVSTGVALQERVWSFVGASFDGESGRVRVWQRPLRTWPGHDATGDGEGRAEGALDASGLVLAIAARAGREEG